MLSVMHHVASFDHKSSLITTTLREEDKLDPVTVPLDCCNLYEARGFDITLHSRCLHGSERHLQLNEALFAESCCFVG